MGFTQEALAAHLGLERSTVGRWERGVGTPQPWNRPDLAKALVVSPDDLAGLLDPGPSDAAEPAHHPVESNAVDHMNADVGLAAAHRTEPSIAQRHSTIADHNSAQHDFDAPLVEQLRTQLEICMTNDGEAGAQKTLPAALEFLRVVEKNCRAAPSDVRADLLSLGACGAEFVGWLFRDGSNITQATFWYDRAMEWAQEAQDLPMQGYVLLKKSQMAYDALDPLRAHTLARAASEGPWHLPLKVHAEVVQQEALAIAMLGEPLAAVERKLGDAAVLLGHATSHKQPASLLGNYFDDTTLRLRNASTFTEAGQPSRAAAIYGDVLSNATLSKRDHGYFRARRAAALALSGEPDEAAVVGTLSAPVAGETGSKRTVRVLTEVARTLAPWRTRPAVAEFRDTLRATADLTTQR